MVRRRGRSRACRAPGLAASSGHILAASGRIEPGTTRLAFVEIEWNTLELEEEGGGEGLPEGARGPASENTASFVIRTSLPFDGLPGFGRTHMPEGARGVPASQQRKYCWLLWKIQELE